MPSQKKNLFVNKYRRNGLGGGKEAFWMETAPRSWHLISGSNFLPGKVKKIVIFLFVQKGFIDKTDYNKSYISEGISKKKSIDFSQFHQSGKEFYVSGNWILLTLNRIYGNSFSFFLKIYIASFTRSRISFKTSLFSIKNHFFHGIRNFFLNFSYFSNFFFCVSSYSITIEVKLRFWMRICVLTWISKKKMKYRRFSSFSWRLWRKIR